MKIQQKVLFLHTWLFILFAQYIEDFTLVWTMFMVKIIRKKFMHNTSSSGSFHAQGHYRIK